MQENLTQVKRAKTLNIIAICLLLVLFTASIFLAVIAPVFTNKVASAIEATLPDNGSVGANLLKNSSDISVAPWYYSAANFIGDNQFQSTADWGCAVYPLFDSVNSKTVTISARVRLVSGTGNVTFNLRRFPSNGGGSVGLNSVTTISKDFVVLSTTYDLSTFDSIKYNLCIYTSKKNAICAVDWVKLEIGSSFTGYVPDYQNQIKDLQDKNHDLQVKYDDFVSEANFSYLSTVSLENAYYFNQNVPERSGTSSYTFGPNASDNSLPEAERNFTCPVNGFYSNTIYRRYLFGVQLPYAVPAGSTIKLNYTCFCVGAAFTGVPFSELWRLGYTYAFFFGQYGYPTVDEPGQTLVVDSFNNANGDIYVKVTSYIAFDVVSRSDNSQRLSGYLSVSDSGVFSLHTDSSLGHQWFLAFNTLNVYYQGDMLAAAVDSAKKDGYNRGYQEGKVAGREVGYQEGIKDNGDYTFMGLLGAVFDAPIQAFKGLLSFEVLGVNMTAFVSSLFGLAVILLIIKLILGGK